MSGSDMRERIRGKRPKRLGLRDGRISAQFHSGRNLFLYGDARGSAFIALVAHICALRAAFRACRGERPFAIDAIVILPEHLHAIFTLPLGDADFSGRWCRIKGHFSSSMIAQALPAARCANGRFALWQRRFWEHTIRDEHDFARHVDYIHFNPVKHGLVARTQDWPHSSFHGYVRHGLLPADWGGDVREIGGRYEFPLRPIKNVAG